MMNVKPLSLTHWRKKSWGDNVFTKAVNGTNGEPDKPAKLTRGSSAAACKERCSKHIFFFYNTKRFKKNFENNQD
jgi:hypothetical protein